jgi:hypothetical protein
MSNRILLTAWGTSIVLLAVALRWWGFGWWNTVVYSLMAVTGVLIVVRAFQGRSLREGAWEFTRIIVHVGVVVVVIWLSGEIPTPWNWLFLLTVLVLWWLVAVLLVPKPSAEQTGEEG